MGLIDRLTRRSRYIPARKTVAAARKAGLSVGDYLDTTWGLHGRTGRIIGRMADAGVFPARHVVEIGAGSGRYMERVLRHGASRYDSYETAPDWAKWLAETYPITSQPTDGETLAHTADGSADLIHAHGVFVYLPFLTSVRYMREILRVAAPQAVVVFDCFTEDCMTPEMVDRWLASADRFPVILPREYVVGMFAGFVLVDTFTEAYGPGGSRYFVFKRITRS